jgi:hypothetical protein
MTEVWAKRPKFGENASHARRSAVPNHFKSEGIEIGMFLRLAQVMPCECIPDKAGHVDIATLESPRCHLIPAFC